MGAAIVALVWGYVGYHFWPWDWRGRRRTVKLKRGRKPWE